ncbi:MAG: hypothetical protein K2Q09_02155, partial [Phycisphaerales bacterium]|nr:hypothetical protein [Phycisphaerales bacterium]
MENTARVLVAPSFPFVSGPGYDFENHAGSCRATAEGAGELGSSGSGTAFADYGFIRLTNQSIGVLTTTCFGEFNDSVTLSVPGVPNGALVTVFYAVEVRGRMSADIDLSTADWSVRSDFGEPPSDMFNSGGWNGPGFAEPGARGKGFGIINVSSQVWTGAPSPLHVEFSASSHATNVYPQAGSAACDDMKCWWRGITSVASNGTPVAGWSVTSASGTDWSGPSTMCRADFGRTGGALVGDGQLDNNDFIAYTDAFFTGSVTADVGTAGGRYGSDGALDSNDFIAFIT